jgi:hypothetical protein
MGMANLLSNVKTQKEQLQENILTLEVSEMANLKAQGISSMALQSRSLARISKIITTLQQAEPSPKVQHIYKN